MQRVCVFLLSLLLVLAAPGLVEGRLLAKATAASKAKEDGDADEEAKVEGETTFGETADGEVTGGEEDVEDAKEATSSDEEATEEAGGEEGDEEGGEDDGEDSEEDDSPVSFVQTESEAESEADAEMDEEMDEETEFLQNADVNKDGKISLEELHQLADRDAADLEKHLSGEEDGELLAVSKKGIQVRKAGMASFLAVADHDKDGFVDAKEVPTLLKAIDEADAKEEETEEEKETAEEEHENEEEDKEGAEADEKEEKEEESAKEDGERKEGDKKTAA